MTKYNKKPSTKITNRAGGEAYEQTTELAFISILLTSFCNSQFYREEQDVYKDLKELITKLDKKFVAKAAIFARNEFGMRSVTHVITGELAKQVKNVDWSKNFYSKIVHRVDDITEIDNKLDYISEELDINRSYGTAEAGSDASNLVCSTLTRATGVYADWHLFMLSGANAGLMRRASSWLLTTHTLALSSAFPNPIAAGDNFQLCSPIAGATHIIGYNDAANDVDTSQVTADRDGSILERVEDLRDLADKRVVGKRQVVQLNVVAAANAGITNLFTVTTQPCVIEAVSIRAQSAAPADLTTCAINAATANIVHLVLVGLATRANLDAIDKQVASTNLAELPVGSIISMDLQGTGPTAVDFIVTIIYSACADGGYINPV